MAVIDRDLKDFLESGLVVLVSTRDAALAPYAVRAWGPQVSEDGASMTVFVDRPSSGRIVANLRDNGRIATCLTDVYVLRSVQLKGRCVEIGDPIVEDWPLIDSHRMAVTEHLGHIGFHPQFVRNLWSSQVVKLRFLVEDIFDQTPGPKAGRPL